MAFEVVRQFEAGNIRCEFVYTHEAGHRIHVDECRLRGAGRAGNHVSVRARSVQLDVDVAVEPADGEPIGADPDAAVRLSRERGVQVLHRIVGANGE